MQVSKLESVVLRNSSQLEQADKFLTYLTIFMPSQSPVLELASEGIVSLSAILQVYKNQILSRLVDEQEKSLKSRYLDAAFKAHRKYRVLAYLLGVIKSGELLAEMAALQWKGDRGRLRAVISIEAVKSALRLAILGMSRRVLPSTVPVHEIDADQEHINKLLDGVDKVEKPKSNFDKIVAEEKAAYKRGPNVQAPELDKLRPASQLIRQIGPEQFVSEVLTILRPVIYASLLYRYRDRKRSWTPWLVGVAIDLAARQLDKYSLNAHKRRPMTGLEKELRQDRDKDLLWWLMRGRMYDEKTRVLLLGIVDKLNKVPILGVGGNLLRDIVFFFDEFYFASATL